LRKQEETRFIVCCISVDICSSLPQHIKHNTIITASSHHKHFVITTISAQALHHRQYHLRFVNIVVHYLKMRYSPIAAGLLTLASHRELLAQAEPCACGYSINTTIHPHFEVFTDYFETDFFHVDIFSKDRRNVLQWNREDYNTSAQKSRGAYGTTKQQKNARLNVDPFDEDGELMHAGGPGMQLIVRHELQDNRVPTAEIAHSNKDVLYGSFRAAIKFSGTNGTCGAFFWYRNDTQEIDVEFLSKRPDTMNFVVHSPDSDLPSRSIKGSGDGGVLQRSHSSTTWQSIQQYPEGFHEYRFDWMPDRVEFFVDGYPAWATTDNIPNSPGHLALSHWSNGNPGWSGGPPMEDAVMTVGYVKAYFNTTASHNKPMAKCGDFHAEAVCNVPHQVTRPEPNVSTHFFSVSHDEIKYDDGSDAKSGHSSASSFGMSGLVWTFLGAVCSAVYCLA
jgi:hypothetical protein